MEKVKDIIQKALELKPADKIMVIEGLLESIDKPNKSIDEIWAIEAEKRLKAFKEGKLKTISYDEVFDRERAKQ